MNPNISQLLAISQKESRNIIGLMSGTSLDGLDIAYCKITGTGIESKVNLIHFDTINYDDLFKNAVRQVFAKPYVDFQYLTILNRHIAKEHSKMILTFMEKYNIKKEDLDLIASHGQTVMHVTDYQNELTNITNATLQIGDGDQIAIETGTITLSDFRQKHIAAGGQGAPLAVYGDYILNKFKKQNVILLNIGGIANFTYIPRNQNFTAVYVTDTGPGNTLIDMWMRKYLNQPYDQDGAIAQSGQIHLKLLKQLKAHPFFKGAFPKSTGPEVFNLQFVEDIVHKLFLESHISHTDIVATLTQYTAETIALAIKNLTKTLRTKIIISGGGAHNTFLVSTIKSLLPHSTFGTSDEMDIPSDSKEAIIFAILANEAVAGNPNIFKGNRDIPAISMGKISFPK